MNPVYRNLSAMGTRMDMVFHGIDEEYGDSIYRVLSREVFRLDELLSNYKEGSAVSLLNSHDVSGFFTPESELFDLILSLSEHCKATSGYFNSFTFLHSEARSPAPGNGQETPAWDSKDWIEVRPSDHSLRFHSSRVSIQTGGFGKGYALDRLKGILQSHSVGNVFISFGESSILTMGNHPWGEGWKISLPDLYTGTGMMEVSLKDQSLSVSGNTPANLKKYPGGHIYNPVKGSKIADPGLVCVTGPSAFVCEIVSTAIFAAQDPETVNQILDNYPDYQATRIRYEGAHSPPEITELRRLKNNP